MNDSRRSLVAEAFGDAAYSVIDYYSDSEIHVDYISDYEADDLLANFECTRDTVSSLILMDGEKSRFGTAIVATEDCLNALGAASYPQDWIGELANMVIGALKNKLLEKGLKLQSGLPRTSKGLRRDYVTQVDEMDALVVDTDSGPVLIVLHLALNDEFEWNEQKYEAPKASGQFMLFGA